jgi:hypothetical protein
MSQVSIIDIEGNNPQIPTQFDGDVGFAIPIANTLEILGGTTAAGIIPVFTSGSGNTITTLVQFSQAIAATDPLRVGLAAFDSADFSVDANGFVSLIGLGALFFNADSGQATPNASGIVNVVGGIGLTSIASGNTITFDVDSSIATSYVTDSGSAIAAGNILNVLGGVGLTSTGSGNNLTINLDSPVVVANGGTGRTTLTVNAVLCGNATSIIGMTNQGTDGQVLIARTAAIPAFATITSTGSTIAFTLGPNTLNMETGSAVAKSFTTNSGTATPSAGILSVVGSHGLNTSGATNIVTVAVNNTLTLGDLSAIAAGSSALTCTTGDITITSGNLNMPSTTSANVGVVEQNGNRFLFSYPDFRNTFLGVASGNFTMTGISNVGVGHNSFQVATSAQACTCVGASSGDSITSGSFTTAIGFGCLQAISTGEDSTGIGYQCMNNNTAAANVAMGRAALFSNTSGTGQTAIGHFSLSQATGSNNTALGHTAGRFLTTGIENVLIGGFALASGVATSVSYNTIVGYNSASQYTSTESSNVLIKNIGTTGDNNKIRIGTQGTGAGQQNNCFIAGIVGVTVANAKPVTINSSTGEMGVGTNSIVAWNNVTGTSATMVAGQGYVANNAGLVTLTLPSSSAIGDTFKIITKGAGFCKIAQNASQTIRYGGSTTTSGVGGSLTSTVIGDCLEIVSTADDEFYVTNSQGTAWTVV